MRCGSGGRKAVADVVGVAAASVIESIYSMIDCCFPELMGKSANYKGQYSFLFGTGVLQSRKVQYKEKGDRRGDKTNGQICEGRSA